MTSTDASSPVGGPDDLDAVLQVRPRWAPLFVEWAVDGTVRACSAAYAEQLGLQVDDVVGSRWPDLVPGEEELCWRQAAYSVQSLQDRDLAVVDMPTRVGGRTDWFRWTEEAVRDEQGRLVAIRSTGIDVTELHATWSAVSRVVDELAQARSLGRQDLLEHLHNGAVQQLAAAKWAVEAGDRDDAQQLIDDALTAVRRSLDSLDGAPSVPPGLRRPPEDPFWVWAAGQSSDGTLPSTLREHMVDAVSDAVAVISSTGSVWLEPGSRAGMFDDRTDVDLPRLLAAMHPDDRAEAAAATVRALAGEDVRLRWRFRHPEHGWRRFVSWLTPLRPAADGTRLAVVLSMDVTDDLGDTVRDVMAARIDERRQLAQELHDDVLQQVAGLRWSLAGRDVGEDALAELDALEAAVRLRLHELDGPVRRVGLEAALLHLLDTTSTPVRLMHTGLERVPEELAAVVWRSAREALRNVDRHAAAASAVVRVECDGRTVRLEVTDDGRGVDTALLHAALRSGHLGVASVREAAVSAGGTFTLRAGETGGTTLVVELPMAGG